MSFVMSDMEQLCCSGGAAAVAEKLSCGVGHANQMSQLLVLAVVHGHAAVVDVLRTFGADVGNALYWAVYEGHGVELLAQIMALGTDAMAGLSCVASDNRGSAEVVEFLLAQKPSDALVSISPEQVLRTACRLNPALAKEMLARGIGCGDLHSCLMNAAREGHTAVVQALLAAGACPTTDRSLALQLACLGQHSDVVDVLWGVSDADDAWHVLSTSVASWGDKQAALGLLRRYIQADQQHQALARSVATSASAVGAPARKM